MERFLKKLRSRSGESITETLVALLISAFALTMLAGAILTSSGIIKRSSDRITKYYTASTEALEEMKGSGIVKIGDDISVNVKYGVNTELGTSSNVIVFKQKESSEAGA